MSDESVYFDFPALGFYFLCSQFGGPGWMSSYMKCSCVSSHSPRVVLEHIMWHPQWQLNYCYFKSRWKSSGTVTRVWLLLWHLEKKATNRRSYSHQYEDDIGWWEAHGTTTSTLKAKTNWKWNMLMGRKNNLITSKLPLEKVCFLHEHRSCWMIT